MSVGLKLYDQRGERKLLEETGSRARSWNRLDKPGQMTLVLRKSRLTHPCCASSAGSVRQEFLDEQETSLSNDGIRRQSMFS